MALLCPPGLGAVIRLHAPRTMRMWDACDVLSQVMRVAQWVLVRVLWRPHCWLYEEDLSRSIITGM